MVFYIYYLKYKFVYLYVVFVVEGSVIFPVKYRKTMQKIMCAFLYVSQTFTRKNIHDF